MSSAFDVTLAVTGASGAPYALRLLQQLLAAEQRVALIVSQAARVVLAQETDLDLGADLKTAQQALASRFGPAAGRYQLFGDKDWMSPVASGSNASPLMIVCPCSMGTLAAISQGMSDNLLERAADVTIKESKRLILVPREMPLSEIHLENMLRLARMGAKILPAMPGFYQRPGHMDELIDFVVGRILDHAQLPHHLGPRWGDPTGAQ